MKLKKWFGVMLTVLMALCFAVAACAPEGGHGAVCEHPADKLVIHEITDDDDKHEVYCTACETVVRTEAHVYDQTTYTCTACEHVCSHTATSWSCNKLTHAEYCSSCGKVITPVGNHVMEDGECSVCGMTQEEIDLEKDPNASDWSIVGKGKGILSASNWGESNIPNSLYLIKDVDFEGAEGEEKFDVTGDFYVGDVFKVFNKGSWDTQVNFTGVQGGKTDDSVNGFKACVKVGKENDNIEVTVNANMTVTLYTGGAGNHLDVKWNYEIDPKPDVPLDYYLVGSIGGDWDSTLVAERKLSLGDNDIYTVDYAVTAADFPDATKWTTDQDIKDLAAHPNCAKLAIVSIEQGADLTGATEEIGILWVPAGTWTFGIVSGSALYWEQGEEPPTFSSFYLRGSLASTNWETGVALTDLGDGSYAIDVTAEVGNEFKIYDNDTGTWYGWPAVSKTDGSSNYVEEKAQDVGGDANIAFTQAGTFTITYKNGTISVAPKAPAHDHVADTEAGWQHDAVGHWHKCTHEGCTEKVDYATHTYDDDSTTCSVCDYEKPTVDPTDEADTRTWYILGKGKGSLKGNNWNHNSGVTFTKGEGNVFTVTVTLYAGDEFKLAYGGAWTKDDNHPNVGNLGKSAVWQGADLFDGTDNLVVKEDGEYTITLYTFITNKDDNLNKDHFDVVKTATVVEPKPENYSMYIVGTINEDAHNTWEDNFNNDTKLTSDDHGVWTKTLEITEQMCVTNWGDGQDGFAYIKVKNDVYGEDYGDNGGNIKLSAGKYIITFTESDGKVTVTPWHEHVADTEAGWQHNADGHWYKCTHEGCDEKVSYAAHDFASGTCVCGATEQADPVTKSEWALIGSGAGILLGNGWNQDRPDQVRLVEDTKFVGATGEKKYDITGEFYVGDQFKLFDGTTWLGFSDVQGGKTDDETYGFKACVKDDSTGNIEVTVNATLTVTLYVQGTNRHIDVKYISALEAKEDDFYLVGSFGVKTSGEWNDKIRTYHFVEGDDGWFSVDVTITEDDVPTASQWPEDTALPKNPGKAKVGVYNTKSGGTVSELWIAPGTYTFHFNGSAVIATEQGQSHPTLSKWYLKGTIGGSNWGLEARFNLLDEGNGKFSITVTVSAGEQFKINDGGNAWYGYDNVTTGKTLVKKATNDGNIGFIAGGDYKITFTGSSISIEQVS